MCNNHFSPVQCIIPPYVNDKLTDSDNKEIAKNAINSKFRSYRFRSDRDFFKDTTIQEKTVLGAISRKPKKLKNPTMEIYNCKRSTSLTAATLVWKDTDTRLPADKDGSECS